MKYNIPERSAPMNLDGEFNLLHSIELLSSLTEIDRSYFSFIKSKDEFATFLKNPDAFLSDPAHILKINNLSSLVDFMGGSYAV